MTDTTDSAALAAQLEQLAGPVIRAEPWRSVAALLRTQAARIAELEAAIEARQVPAVTAREVARQVFALCEATEDEPASPADDYGLGRFRAGQRFEARRIRNSIGNWLTDEEITRAAPTAPAPPPEHRQESSTGAGLRPIDLSLSTRVSTTAPAPKEKP